MKSRSFWTLSLVLFALPGTGMAQGPVFVPQPDVVLPGPTGQPMQLPTPENVITPVPHPYMPSLQQSEPMHSYNVQAPAQSNSVEAYPSYVLPSDSPTPEHFFQHPGYATPEDLVIHQGYQLPSSFSGRVGSPYYYSAGQNQPGFAPGLVVGPAGHGGIANPGNGSGFYRSGEQGHIRYPYYSYRRPWYHPGFPGYNRDTNLPW